VKRVVGLVAVLVTSLVGCAEPEPETVTAGAWPTAVDEPDVIDIEIAPEVVVTPPELVDEVIVEPDALVFAAEQAEAVAAAFPVGAPVVGGRAEGGIEANSGNPLGYLRKVTGVRTEGDFVVVDTEPATLPEIMTGTVSQTFDPNESLPVEFGDAPIESFFPRPTPENGGDNTGTPGGFGFLSGDGELTTPALTMSLNGTLNDILKIDQTFVLNDGEATLRVRGSGDFTGAFSFSPLLHVAWDVDSGFGSLSGPYLDTFEISARGDLSVNSRLDFDVTAAVVSGEADEVSLDSEVPAFPDDGGWISKLIKESRPYAGPTIGPVPTTYRVYLYLDCRYALHGNLNGHVSTNLDIRGARVGAEYTDEDGFSPIGDFPIRAGGDVSVSKSGAALVECGLRPQIDWRFADLAGPYINTRASLELSGDYNEVCPAQTTALYTRPSDGIANMKLAANFSVNVGGEVDLYVDSLGIGPFAVYERRFDDLYRRQLTFSGLGARACAGLCDNGSLDNGETDIDCSGPCPKCANGRSCRAQADCSSSICSADEFLCVATTCEDNVQDEGETGIDCGTVCGRSCGAGSSCTVDAECTPLFCSNRGFCTDNACQNGRADFGEPNVDCGGPCEEKCRLGSACNVGGDCNTNVCSIANVCVTDRCQDGRKNFGETDVDCGGPFDTGCAARCTRGCQVNTDCSQDAGLRVCGAQNTCVTTCQDGRKSPGEAGVDCGGVCASGPTPQRCDVNVACTADNDCASGVCNDRVGRCVVDACQDGELNGSESSTDCGGSCVTCGLQKRCNGNSDCQSGLCGSNNTCVADQCHDGIANGSETDVDCGGTCLDDCPTQGGCNVGDDCKSGLCVDNICISDRCKDRVQNGTETGVDCGGTCGPDCAVGVGCLGDNDCQSGLCNLVTRTCAADECGDGVLNNDESDVDCGGSCDGCLEGGDCEAAGDCDSGICNVETLTCGANHCDSGLIDVDETDVDCGGSCGNTCGFTQACSVNGDCRSGECLPNNTCAQDVCSNGVQDGDETGVDCGGGCEAGCAVGQGCEAPSDCASDFCQSSTNTCVDDHCVDGVKDADESGLDCGGNTCGDCGVGQGCVLASDCASTFCSVGGVCVASRCQDGFANGGETDVDCGGANSGCGKCSRGRGCVTFNDCVQSAGFNNDDNTVDDNQCVTGQCTQALPRNCEQLFTQRGIRADGVYTIDLDGFDRQNSFPTYCNMTEGGWTLVWMVNSQFIGTAFIGNQVPPLGDFFGNTIFETGLVAEPSRGLFAFGSLPFTIGAGNSVVKYNVARWISYDNGVERFRSDEIPRSAWRLAANTVASPRGYGYQLFGPKYFMCAGDFEFTDNGIGQELQPPGALNDCKGHGGLAGGYDFSETATRVNEGLMASGRIDFLGPRIAPNNGVMSTAPANVGGRFVTYGNPGAIQTVWLK
jgi:hypothetical protein